MTAPRAVVVEADGGSRGNPGQAAYGALVRDADTGELLAQEGVSIGIASNNVAEYSGLLAGLRLAAEVAPEASVEVRMDSKLVVEQMSGRWRIKHPDMQDLASRARALAPAGTSYTWIPRADNQDADRLVNQALDGRPTRPADDAPDSVVEAVEDPRVEVKPAQGWSPAGGPPTTLVLVRHGVTAHTSAKRFSGGLASSNPPLSDEGRDQVRLSAEWLAPIAERASVVVASPVRRTLESAAVVAEVLGLEVEVEPGFAEMEFGVWDGLTFAEVAERDQAGLDAWLGSLDVAPEGGESFRVVRERVVAGLQRVLRDHAGEVVVVVSHVTPIKTLVAEAVGAPLGAVFRMELSPASVTVLSFFPDPDPAGETRASMRLYNALPPGRDAFASGTW